MRSFAIVALLLTAGCRERPPPVPSFADLDASPPEAGFRGAVVGGGGGRRSDAGRVAPPSGSCRGTLLVIFDRSGSMNDEWEPGRPKWQAALDALLLAIEPLEDRLDAGAILFPSARRPHDGVCAPVDPIEAQVPFGPGEGFAAALRAALDEVGGNTPLGPAFARADEALRMTEVHGVVVLTDGQPTLCVGERDAASVAASWRGAGVQTWVIGLPGLDDPGVLDAVAEAGGTTAHVPVDDPSALEDALTTVALESYTQACP